MHKTSETVPELIRFSLLTILLYFVVQTMIIILHEYAHSATAWLLGYTPTFRTVIWGNPLTIIGWDEGVPYDRIFRSAGHPAEAAIGGAPLLMHTIFTVLSLYWLQRTRSKRMGWWFYAVFWFVVVNLTELVAYLTMRPFAGSGDTGRFNEGLSLSPWLLFVVGNLLLVFALRVLLLRVLPKLDGFLGTNRKKHWIAAGFGGFMIFLGGSGLRVMLLYPDSQWKWGLIGLPAFFCWLFLARPLKADAVTGSHIHI